MHTDLAGFALRGAHVVESLLVGALVEEVARGGMALPADRGHRLDLGRIGPVVAVAVVAGRRGHVLLIQESLGVDALLPLGGLVGRDLVGLHILGVGVAATAGGGHVPGEDGGLGELGRQDAVVAVAVRADGRLGVALLEQPAVLAGPILVQLVDPQLGVGRPHVGRVGVAAAAELGDLGPLGGALEGLVLGLVLVRGGGVAAMAVPAGQAELGVGVLGVLHGRGFELAVQLEVAVETTVGRRRRGLGQGPRRQEEKDRSDEDRLRTHGGVLKGP
jgi:hypothetical protein